MYILEHSRSVPNADAAVVGGAVQPAAIHGDGIDGADIPLQRPFHLPVVDVPHANQRVVEGSDELAVHHEKLVDASRVPSQRHLQEHAVQVPDSDVHEARDEEVFTQHHRAYSAIMSSQQLRRLQSLPVPQPDSPVEGSTENMFVVGLQRTNGFPVHRQGLRGYNLNILLARVELLHLPDLNLPIVTPREQLSTHDLQGKHRLHVPSKHVQASPALRAPHTDSPVDAPAEQQVHRHL
mmetsp:Transcript_7414/g.25336  ORF Transcript_7414/g.25336 Transcript_7414/m.25336 type:complete len:237 (+) Transcript_7414:45-755(+)